MPAMTRGPLPVGVYWRRRLFIGLLALSIVFVIGSWLGSGSDGSSEEPVARQAGAEATHTVTLPSESSGSPSGQGTVSTSPSKQQQKKQKKAQLAEPSGTCAAGDIRVTPVTKKAVAGRDIEITLSLQTRTDPACHWRVGKGRLAVRISGGGGEVWSTRHCTDGIPSKKVVLRRSVATELQLTWDARRSDEGCPRDTEWVLPGEYVVSAAVLGGEPREQALELVAPKAGQQQPEHPAEQKTGNALERIGQGNQ